MMERTLVVEVLTLLTESWGNPNVDSLRADVVRKIRAAFVVEQHVKYALEAMATLDDDTLARAAAAWAHSGEDAA
jgi:hypothetical protein